LWELGAEVIRLPVTPDAAINGNCGSTYPASLQETS